MKGRNQSGPGVFLIAVCTLTLLAWTDMAQTREVKIKACADGDFRKDPAWGEKAGDIIVQASADFEKNFGIVILQDARDRSRLMKTLKYELGHLFGAAHMDDSSSLMDIFGRGDSFDADNQELIRLHKFRSFKSRAFPTPAEHWDAASSRYRRILNSIKVSKTWKSFSRVERSVLFRPSSQLLKNRAVERQHESSLAEAYVLLAGIFIEKKDYQAAIAEAKKCFAGAIEAGPRFAEAHANLGYCLLVEKQAVIKFLAS